MERTLIILKPDAVQRRLVGRIITRFEEKGLKIAAVKFMQITRALAERHYAVHEGKPFYDSLLDFITHGPVVVMALEGSRAIEVARRLMGATFGYNAEPGTIRGDFGVSNQYNLVHGSDSPETAKFELDLYFTGEDYVSYALIDDPWNADK